MDKVVVGMSGGVDSAVAAYLLKQAGYDVIGITLRVWQGDDGNDGRCCDIDDARSVANKLKIPYYPINCISDFKKCVVEPFANGYLCGLTPNPCIECNRFVKWEKLLYYANVVGAKYVATGHYASVVKTTDGRYTLKKAMHTEKDQTYMLYKLTQEQLSRTLMPLGNLSKKEVRKIAENIDISLSQKKDSQEVCFVTEGSYADYITKTISPKYSSGLIVDENGNILGKHKGIMHYTIGQRKGLGISTGYPIYVKEICSDENKIVVGNEQSLYSRKLICKDINFMSISELNNNDKISCFVKVRYRHTAQPAHIEPTNDNLLQIEFEEPIRAATPGQSAVFYNGDGCIIGGGIISKVLK